jgi:4-hydroxybenzoate polyprenyltransferase
MMIIPLVDLYATACDWWPREAGIPNGLFWFLAVSYTNGIVIETGRKIRAPQDEEAGVNTYSAIWGPRTAALVWYSAMLLTAVFAAIAALRIDFLVPVSIVLALLLLAAGSIAVTYVRAPDSRRAKRIEVVSGLWTVLMYVTLGAIPLLWRYFTQSAEG